MRTFTVCGIGRPDVDADRGRLQQIVVNLVSNAARYGTAPIEIGAVEEDDHVRCWVRVWTLQSTAHPLAERPDPPN